MTMKTINFSFYVSCICFVVVCSHLISSPTSEKKVTGNFSVINDTELKSIAEELFLKSSHELRKCVSINYQGRIKSKNDSDNAPERLLIVSPEILSIPSVKSFIKLFDNYEIDTYKPENITEEEDAEENEFIDNLIQSNVVLQVMDFLSAKGLITNDTQDYKAVLKKIWFHPYSRSKGVNGSSGFEHVFMVEKRPRKGIIGLHNWIFFNREELTNRINYFGFTRNVELTDRVAIAHVYFTYDGKQKMSTIFIGTTPELEIALYTLCFFARPNKKCKVSFTGLNFNVQTYMLRNGSGKYVAAAFPVI